MPNDLLQRPQSNDYDENWQPQSQPQGDNDGQDNFNGSMDGDNSGYDQNDPSSKTKGKKSLDGDQLAGAESKAGDNSKPTATGAALPGESKPGGSSDKLGKGFTGGLANQAAGANPTARLAKAALAIKNNKGKSAGIGGTIVTLIIILMSFTGGAFELIHVRENLLGNSPFSRAQKSGLKFRQGKAVAKIIRALTKTPAVGAVANENFAESFRKKGFDVQITEGKLTKFSYTSAAGEVRSLSDEIIETKGLKTATKDFFEGPLGREISGRIDNVVSSEASLVKGVRTTKLYAKLGTNLQNWLDRGIAKAGPDLDDAQLQEKVIKDMALNDGAPANDIKEGLAGRTTADLDAEKQLIGADDKPLAADEQPRTSTSATPGSAADEAIDGAADAKLSATVGDLGTISTEAGAKNLTELAVKAGIRGSIKSAVKSTLSPTEVANLACKLKGAAQYVGSVRNVLLAVELGKLSIRFMSASDHVKAGILTGSGLALFMKYLKANDGYLSDGGMQFHMGNASARPSKAAGMFNLSRRPNGIVGKFLSYVDGTGAAQGCKVVTNGWFQIGQAVVMGVANIPTLGGASASSIALQAIPIAILGAGVEIAIQIGTSMATKAAQQQVMSGISAIDGGQLAGAAIGAGFGSQMAMTGSVNGSIVSTQTQAAYLRNQADQDRQYALSKTSLFDRYFNTNKYDSLASQVAFRGRSSTGNIEAAPTKMLAAVTNLFSSPLSVLSANTYAATNQFGCDDPQLTDHNIETDPFCNPLVATTGDVDLDNAENVMQRSGMIDSLGNPAKESPYESFVNKCFSGRTGLLYVEKVDKNGGNDGPDNTCIGEGLVELKYAVAEKFSTDPLPDNRPWYAKILSKPVNAAPTETTRIPTTVEYFTAWYAYMGDKDNILGSTSSSSQSAVTNGQAPPVGTFQDGTSVPGTDTSKMACPVSPTVTEIGVVRVFANGTGFYNIKLCKVHGYSINAVKAKDFDDMYNAMIAAGFKPVTVNNNGEYVRDGGGGNFRTYEAQQAGYARNPSAWASAGGSNHERGLAVDIACANNDNSLLYHPWMTGKARTLPEFSKALAEHPCLNWIHNNSSKYKLLLQCDGKGSSGGEIAGDRGGCETWHLSPNGK